MEDTSAVAAPIRSLGVKDAGPLTTGRGTVGRVHSRTVNGRANDLSYRAGTRNY